MYLHPSSQRTLIGNGAIYQRQMRAKPAARLERRRTGEVNSTGSHVAEAQHDSSGWVSA
jgi:hypothetical protein